MAPFSYTSAWQALKAHGRAFEGRHLRELFANDRNRFQRLSLTPGQHGLDGLLMDCSKQRLTEETVALLMDLVAEADIDGWRRRLFAGEPINETEGRPVLHPALRAAAGIGETGDEDALAELLPADAVAHAQATREKIARFVGGVVEGTVTSSTGVPFTDVVNIGIGGSDLGPRFVADALRARRRQGMRTHFVANVDGSDFLRTVVDLDPATTLFVVASKTFTTQETRTNAETAKAWLAGALGPAEIGRHFAAVTANQSGAMDFGVAEDRIFSMLDGVGGRFSLWSAVGLSVALGFGHETFTELLAGAHDMDRHFFEAPLERNLPVLLAAIGIWNVNFLDLRAHAVLPYDHRLRRLPAYLQQLEMESNGKSIDRAGERLAYRSCPFVFGEAGTMGQHAFYQLLHQGTETASADFIAVARSEYETGDHQEKLLANCLAQSEALMHGCPEPEARRLLAVQGRSESEVDHLGPHLAFEGNRPSTTLVLDTLSPRNLGRLLALYEHKVFVQGIVWGINSFDQWGVELGKRLAAPLLQELKAAPAREQTHGDKTHGGEDAPTHQAPVNDAPASGVPDHDSSTQGLLDHLRAVRGRPA